MQGPECRYALLHSPRAGCMAPELPRGRMISLKKYWDAPHTVVEETPSQEIDRKSTIHLAKGDGSVLDLTVAAYQSALREMGSCSVEACTAVGTGLKQSLDKLEGKLSSGVTSSTLASTEKSVRDQLQDWGRRTAAHYREKTAEVKDLLLVMTRAAESVGERDQRCARQMSDVTTRLKAIATLEDLTQIRSSIEKSAVELKMSLDRMAVEGKQAIAELKAEVSVYQVKLEEAEQLASKDALTGLRNRNWVEKRIERRIEEGTPLAVAIVDIDAFKCVNDEHGHVVGDDLLKEFSGELKWASRAGDVIGRWGGDEFILVLDSTQAEAEAQVERLRDWMSGSYNVQSINGPLKLKVQSSIGFASHVRGESMKDLLARADAAMYQHKRSPRGAFTEAKR
jgi:diguanylate cyclase (GGDEF)-like protein